MAHALRGYRHRNDLMFRNGTVMNAKRLFLATLFVMGSAAPVLANWQQEISPYDSQRLAGISESRARGLAAVDSGASPIDSNAIHGVLDPAGSAISAQQLTGNWRCRLMKLGGLTPAIVYGWQTCRFRSTPNGLFFEKVTGTQRLSGYADPDGDRFVLLAGMTVRNDGQRGYSGGSRGFGAPSTPTDQVGVISAIGSGRARIEFPFPILESDFDVIELQR